MILIDTDHATFLNWSTTLFCCLQTDETLSACRDCASRIGLIDSA